MAPSRRHALYLLLAAAILGAIAAFLFIRLDWKENTIGLYLIRDDDGTLVVTNDIYPDEADRHIAGIDFPAGSSTAGPISLTWDRMLGRGYIQGIFDGGKRILFCFSRYKDDDGRVPSGLFIGGGLPGAELNESDDVKQNETSISWFDGKRWYHIWCNLNEGVVLVGRGRPETILPTSWTYRGSKVFRNPDRITLTSDHTIMDYDIPISITRTVTYRAGTRFIILSSRFRNSGTRPTTFYYMLGDEPWLGDFGSSAGDIGWSEDRFYQYESIIDTRKTTYAGFFDYGNDAVGEGHAFTNVANFFEWLPSDPPQHAFFTNDMNEMNPESKQIPLASADNRFLSLQWGPIQLSPGEERTISVAIGMADRHPVTGMPVKPAPTFVDAPTSFRTLSGG